MGGVRLTGWETQPLRNAGGSIVAMGGVRLTGWETQPQAEEHIKEKAEVYV